MEECPLNNRYLQHSPLTIALKSLNFSLWLLWPFRIGCQEVDFYYWPSRGTPPATLIERHELALRWPLRKLVYLPRYGFRPPERVQQRVIDINYTEVRLD